MGPSQDFTYAGFWKRLAALIVDYLIIILVYVIVIIITAGYSGEVGRQYDMFYMIFVWLYYALLESSEVRATLGKRALNLIVTDLEGNRISFLRATGRYFGKILSAFIFMIGFLMAGFTQRKQALHDILASCLVLYDRRGARNLRENKHESL
ncbi:MAG: RDD family protein [Balneolales bacterium]